MVDAPLVVEPDGLYTPDIKRHSLEKIRLHNRYAQTFAAAMYRKWPQMAYLGLYAGAGHAHVAGTTETVETSALAVLRQQPRFTDYIYVDNDPRCVSALTTRTAPLVGNARLTIIPGDVNESADAIVRAMPTFGPDHGLLSFCFIDPFDLQLRFDTIRALSRFRIDFLVLLMLGVDARRNFRLYLDDPASSRIGDLIDCPDWRNEYQPGQNVIHFLLSKFDQAMQRLGYPSASDQAHPIRVTGMGVLQYVLAFYSRNPLGARFWRDARAGITPQLNLGF